MILDQRSSFTATMFGQYVWPIHLSSPVCPVLCGQSCLAIVNVPYVEQMPRYSALLESQDKLCMLHWGTLL